MSNNRVTLASTNARIDSLESKLDAILAHLEPKAPAKPQPKAAKAPKKAAPKKPQPKADRKLCKATRLAFIAAAAKQGVDFSGWSTKAIAGACIDDPSLVPAGFAIGEGYKALLG